MADTNYNIVTWSPYSKKGLSGDTDPEKRMAMRLKEPFKLSGGLTPDLNHAVVPFGEFDKLGEGDLEMHGDLEFWFSSSPNDGEGSPDHKISAVKIIDVVPERMGTPQGQQPRCIEYEITFADVRHILVAPRGGRLRRGIINPYPNPSSPVNQNGDPYEETSNDDLLASAADASFPNGQKGGAGSWDYGDGVYDALTSAENLRNIAWNGSHAPTELGKVLEYLHLVASLQSDGSVIINAIGSGEEPELPNMLMREELTGIDRRGATCVITSAPVPAYRTWTTTSAHPPKFNFVLSKDNQTSWLPLATVLKDGAAAITSGWSNYSDQEKKMYAPLAYRAIQLDTTQFNPSFAGVLKLANIDSVGRQQLTVQAKIAFQQKDGTWANSTTPVTVSVKQIYHNVNVLVLSDRLGTMSSSPAGNPDSSFVPLDLTSAAAFQISFSAEDWIPVDPQNNQSVPQKKFFVTGFQQDVNNEGSGGGDSGLTELKEDEALALIDTPDPDTVILSAPHLVQISSDDDGKGNSTKDNRSDLVAKAKLIAQQYLAGSGMPATYIECSGFVAVELNGTVAGVEWDQEKVTTRVKLNTWWVPSESKSRQQIEEMEANFQFPMQMQTQTMAVMMGHSEQTVPSSIPDNSPVDASEPSLAAGGLKNDVITKYSDGGPPTWGEARWL